MVHLDRIVCGGGPNGPFSIVTYLYHFFDFSVLSFFIMFSEFLKPLVHTVNLEFTFSLSGAFVNVSFRPFSVSRRDLFDTTDWVILRSFLSAQNIKKEI